MFIVDALNVVPKLIFLPHEFSFSKESSKLAMFRVIFSRLVGNCLEVQKRDDGVAFFTAAKELYGFSSIAYMNVNIQVPMRHPGCFLHCLYTDTYARHCVTREAISTDPLSEVGLIEDRALVWPQGLCADRHEAGCGDGTCDHRAQDERAYAFSLRPRGRECAFFALRKKIASDDAEHFGPDSFQDIKVLGNYFHSHILRINGHDAESNLLVSARELDCLKWTAAGKTAWEASVILGISERTVRFHLNAAREKLNCATTTQAVAKAISYQLIDV